MALQYPARPDLPPPLRKNGAFSTSSVVKSSVSVFGAVRQPFMYLSGGRDQDHSIAMIFLKPVTAKTSCTSSLA